MLGNLDSKLWTLLSTNSLDYAEDLFNEMSETYTFFIRLADINIRIEAGKKYPES